ncbi:hypothetical protein ILUMI_03026, partial [Ignelater luminosus]
MSRQLLFFLLILTFTLCLKSQNLSTESFPDDFIFGTASSAYQTEGAWNEDGKGENIWDHMTHTRPDKIADGSNGDIACNSYHKTDEDVALLKSLGVDHYRFSLSWARILPTGLPNQINQAGIDYYNQLIDKLLENGITPVVTIFHWDLPQRLQEIGGFTNSFFITWFTDFAKIVFQKFGDRVKFWTTFNEPKQICNYGYGTGRFAPGIVSSGIGDYICTHNLIKAHAQVYHLYNEVFRPTQKGRIGIVIECGWAEPGSSAIEDIEAAERQQQFECGLYANPIFSKHGDYPAIVKDCVADRSKKEGFPRSRLPAFTTDEIRYIRGTSDYFGINHYITALYVEREPDPIGEPSFDKDLRVKSWQDPSWPANAINQFRTVPWGLRNALKWIKDTYNDPEIYITENGAPDDKTTLHDTKRIDYHLGYLSSVLDAIYIDKVKVKSYFLWSFMDYFEWDNGHTVGFGLHYVNYTDPGRPRILKDSAGVY